MTRRPLRFVATLLLCAASALGLPPGAALAQRAQAADDPDGARVIVKYKALGGLMRAAAAGREPMRGPQHAAAMSRRSGLALSDGRVIDARTQVLRGQGLSSQQLAARLAADDEVEYAVPDQRRRALAVPNDPRYAGGPGQSPVAGQWYLRAPDATLVSAINAAGAWDVTTGSPAIVVAVLDTGVRPDHEDLASQLVAGYDFIADLADARDGDGRDADASDPGDWSTANQCGAGEPAAPSSWHGTKMAALIAAQANNGIGMAGVGWNLRVQPVRVLGACGGYDSDILAGMLWAGGVSNNPVPNPHPARVINLSLGSIGTCSAAYRDAVSQLTAAGVVVVAAAGNEEGLAVGTPANCPGVIAVAALRHTGTKVGFSSIGPEVAISAPGGNCVNLSGECLYPILTATNAGLQGPDPRTNVYTNGSDYSVGTSFSAPLVSGTVGLMLAANPALTPAQVRGQLQTTTRPFPATSSDPTVVQCRAPSSVSQIECLCTTSTCGAGMLDAAGAVRAAAATAAPSVRIAAGADSVLAGQTLTLDGSGTRVASGRSIASWRWAITSGGAIAAFAGDSSGPTVQVRTAGLGSFTVQLTVTDSAGVQASASRSVAVNAPAAPVVRLLPSATVVTAGGRVDLDASTSTAASGLAVAAWRWAITGGADLASITAGANEAVASVTTRGSSSGSFTVQVTVTDSLGQESSASVTVGVTPLGPTASIQATAAAVTAGATVGFDAAGSGAQPGRSLVGWRWEITSGGAIAAISGSNSAPTATVTTSGPGSFTVRLTVTDSAGAQDSRTATVTVNAGGGGATGAGSGGGAMGVGWLLGLALAVLALAWPPLRDRWRDGRWRRSAGAASPGSRLPAAR